MLTLYLVFAILGLAVFALSAFGAIDDHDFGHDFHIGDHPSDVDDPGVFSLRTISAALAGFGTAGIIAKLVLNWPVAGQVFLGFLSGLILAFLVYLLMKAFMSQQAGDVEDSAILVGRVAVITTPVGDQGIGECRVGNIYYTFREKNGVKLEANQTAKVISTEPGLLIVEKI